MPPGKDAFNAIRRYLHNPQVTTADVKALCDEFCRTYHGNRLCRKLRMKYLFHRVLMGHKYHRTKPFTYGLDFMAERVQSHSAADPRDILLISHEMSLTGAPRALLTLGIALKKAGFRPAILTLRNGDLIAEAEARQIPVVADISSVLKSSIMPSDRGSELCRFIQSFPTIFYNTLEAMMLFTLIPAPGARKLGWIHEAEGAYHDFNNNNDFGKFISQFDDIFIVGDFARSHAVKRSPLAENFKNLYYGVEPLDDNICQSKHTFLDGRIHILMAGSLNRRKGHYVLAEALGMLDDATLDAIHIHVVGSALKTNLAQKLKAAGKGAVSCPGEMPHDELMRLFASMDALLCPSLDDPMPIVCTEAFQLGVAVLVSDHTGTASFIRDGKNGFLVKAGDAQSLADGIKRIVAMRNRLPQIGDAARSIYEDNFRMEAFEQHVKEIFSTT